MLHSPVQVACWRGLAEAVEEQLRKGDTVVVDGKLMLNSYQGQEGVQKKSFEIEANAIEKLAGKSQPVLVPAGDAGRLRRMSLIEEGAGRDSGFEDELYRAAGAEILDVEPEVSQSRRTAGWRGCGGSATSATSC